MKKKDVIRRIRQKLVKIGVYDQEARKLYGPNIAREMFHEDMDFLSTVLYLLDKVEDDGEK